MFNDRPPGYVALPLSFFLRCVWAIVCFLAALAAVVVIAEAVRASPARAQLVPCVNLYRATANGDSGAST